MQNNEILDELERERAILAAEALRQNKEEGTMPDPEILVKLKNECMNKSDEDAPESSDSKEEAEDEAEDSKN